MLKNFIKKVLGNYAVDKLYDIRVRSRKLYNSIISSNLILLWLDTAFNSYFIRENKSVRIGLKKYFHTQYVEKNNSYLLRRNIHRIEKGLLMQPRRSEFALSYIFETIILLRNIDFTKDMDTERWAFDVLSKYFLVTKSTNKIYLEAKNIFTPYANIYYLNENLPQKSPYKRRIVNEIVSPSDLLELFRYRKSIRWFDNSKKVPEYIIENALEAATLAPSSCNRQPYTYYITTDGSKATELAKISAGTVGWAENIPNLAIVVGNQGAFESLGSRHSIYVDSSLSIMQFILQLEANGVSSCLINWADIKFRDKKLRKLLSLDKSECVVLSIAFGYSNEDGLVAYSQRKNTKGIVKYV